MKILITGISGTGKTTILAELQKHGYVVIDLDATGMCRWRNIETGKITQYGPDGRDKRWLDEHEWFCDTEVLKKLLSCIREDKDVFVACYADNLEDILQEFDKVFLLTAPDDVIKERLTTRRSNHFGRKAEEQEVILGWKDKLKGKIESFSKVDSQKNPSEVAEFILNELRNK